MPKVGFIRQTSSIGWDLRYARNTPLPDGGERVVIATDRPISTWEAATQPRTIDYLFTVIEMRRNAGCEGATHSRGVRLPTVDSKNRNVAARAFRFAARVSCHVLPRKL
jgi:hypothetical protein